MRLFAGLIAALSLSLSLSAQTNRSALGNGSGAPASSKKQVVAVAQLPPVIVSCEGDQCDHQGAGLWVFDGNEGRAAWGYGAVANMTIDSFDGHSIVISRADPRGTYSSRWAMPDGIFRARYTGTVDGNMIHGSVYFNGDSAHPASWQATIQSSICSIPQDCALGASSLTAFGLDAYKAGRHAVGLKILKAASAYDPDAEGYVAYIMGEDKSKVEQARAFTYARQSAEAGSGVGMVALGDFYRDGIGTAVNAQTATYWTNKGEALIKASQQTVASQTNRGGTVGVDAILWGIMQMMLSGDQSSGSYHEPFQTSQQEINHQIQVVGAVSAASQRSH